MAAKKQMKMVAFDLGGVLIDIDKSGVSDSFFREPYFTDFMLGKISSETYFAVLSAQGELAPNVLKKTFTGMVKPAPYCEALLSSIKKPFTFWSNINQCHFEHILSLSRLIRHNAQSASLSFQMGQLKPNVGFFETSLKKTAIPPSQILFLDDKLDNIVSAQLFGINSCLAANEAQIREVLLCLED